MSHVFKIGGALAALADLGLYEVKQAAQEFAPGIPKGKPISRLPSIKPSTLNRWTLAVQDHEAERAGRHFDLRLVDPDAGKAHSWAIPKAKLPDPGEKILAVQTFTHTPEYALHFGDKKPEVIEKGYGKGRVHMAVKAPVDIIEANNDKVRFNIYEGKNNQEYVLRRTRENKWLLQNVTATKETHPVPQSKPAYKDMSPDKVDVTDDSHLMMAKVDGAHNTIELSAGQPVRIFSYRPTERSTGLIEHTHRFLPGFTTRVPAGLDGLVLRGELFASDPHTGRARDAVETGAVLNSGVWKSRDAQSHAPLRAVIFDVARRAGKNVEELPYAEKLDILRKVNKGLPFLELPPMASTAKEKIDLLNRVRTGQEPITSEGVVLWPLGGGAPIKAKFRPDHDVYVREVFPEEGKREGLAGGFTYSWTPRGKVVGRVGTGITHNLKQDMLENPEKYIGRVARVRALGLYTDKDNPKKPGALRAPSFRDWHLDKGMQPLEEKTSQLYHFTDPKSHAQIQREGLLRPLDEVHPEKAHDYKGRGITAEQELRKQKILKPDEPYTNFGVFTTPLPPGSIDRSWFKGPHVRVRPQDIPEGSVLAYRHPDTGRTIRRPYSDKEVAKALALWTPPRIEAYLQELEAKEQKTGKKRFPFLKLPQVVSFKHVPVEKTSELDPTAHTYRERRGNCGPASLRIALRQHGLDAPEKVLAKIVKNTADGGTKPEDLAHAVGTKIIESLSLGRLKRMTDKGTPVIVAYQESGPVTGNTNGHYSVVSKVDDKVHLSDPSSRRPLRAMPLEDFQARWHDVDKDDKERVRLGIPVRLKEK